VTIIYRRPLKPASSLEGRITVPSDKSIAHRALICAALANGRSEISLDSPGLDVRSTVSALESLGVPLKADHVGGAFLVEIQGLGDDSIIGSLPGGIADCGNSGTSMRLLTGALASGAGVATSDRRRVAQPPADGAHRRATARDGCGG